MGRCEEVGLSVKVCSVDFDCGRLESGKSIRGEEPGGVLFPFLMEDNLRW